MAYLRGAVKVPAQRGPELVLSDHFPHEPSLPGQRLLVNLICIFCLVVWQSRE